MLYLGANHFQDYSYEPCAAQVCGFTQEEVEKLLEYYDISHKTEAVKHYYNGYRFSYKAMDKAVYNPWSIKEMISNEEKCECSMQ